MKYSFTPSTEDRPPVSLPTHATSGDDQSANHMDITMTDAHEQELCVKAKQALTSDSTIPETMEITDNAVGSFEESELYGDQGQNDQSVSPLNSDEVIPDTIKESTPTAAELDKLVTHDTDIQESGTVSSEQKADATSSSQLLGKASCGRPT